MIEYGLDEIKLPEVFATVDNEHSASIRVLEKAGMNFLRYEYDDEGSYSVYSIKGQNRLPQAGGFLRRGEEEKGRKGAN